MFPELRLCQSSGATVAMCINQLRLLFQRLIVAPPGKAGKQNFAVTSGLFAAISSPESLEMFMCASRAASADVLRITAGTLAWHVLTLQRRQTTRTRAGNASRCPARDPTDRTH